MLWKVQIRLCQCVGSEKKAGEVLFHCLLFIAGARYWASCWGFREREHLPLFSKIPQP